jgi:transcriptional/translational regulatory protein YebC/TACO1
VSIESARFEGYGPGGAAVIVDCQADNHHRTVAELRHVFRSYGGHLGAPGSVAYLFKPVGRLSYAAGADLAGLKKAAFDAGAEDVFERARGAVEVLTDPWELESVRKRLSAAGLAPASFDVTERASVRVALAGEAAIEMMHLLEALRGVDRVTGVYSIAEISDEVVAQL